MADNTVPAGLIEEKLQPEQSQGVPEGLTEEKLQPTVSAHTAAPAQKEPGMIDTAEDYWGKKTAPVDKAITDTLAPNPQNYSSLLKTNAIEVPKTLGRELYSGAKTALGMIPGAYHAFADPATAEEQARYAPMEREMGEAPGAETSGLKRLGLGVNRMLGGDATAEAYKTYANPATRPTYEQALSVAPEALGQGAGTVLAAEAGGKGLKKIATTPLSETMPTVAEGVRKAGKAYQTVRENAPTTGAVIGGVAGGAAGGPGGAAYGTYTGGRVGKILQNVLPEGKAVAEFDLTPEEKNVQRLEKSVKEAEKKAQPAQEAYDTYEAGRQRGIPAPDEVLKAHEKSQKALQLAKDHLQAAREAAEEAKAAAGADQPITPAEVAAARPEAPTPTKEENDAKLMGMMNKIAPAEGAPAQNVKTPGQVQPETFPQEPQAAPRVDETTQMRTLGGGKGVIEGRPPRLLTEGVPEAPPAAPPAVPEAPKGEVLPPEKPAKPGRLAALKAEGGKIVDTEPALQQKIEEGLQGTAKPVAIPPKEAAAVKAPEPAPDTAMKTLGAKEAEALGKIKPMPAPPEFNERGQRLGVPTETPQDFGTKVRAEAPPMPRGERRGRVRTDEENATTEMFRQARKELGENATSDQIAARMEELKGAPKAEAAPAERSPEDLSKIERFLSDHTDQELIREAKRKGLDESQYDFNKREGENRHRIEREKLVKDIVQKMPEEEKDKAVKFSDAFDNKDDSTWTQAERSNLSRAGRARAIRQEMEGGPKPISGGAPDEVAGSEESSKKDRDHFAQAKQELPDGTISQQLLRAQELKEQAAKPAAAPDLSTQAGQHNANGGSTFHPEQGDLKGKPYFAVGGEPEFRSPELKMTVDGSELTHEQLKEFAERPEVKVALAKHPDASIGTWHDQGEDQSVVELVKTPTDREAAIKMGTDNGEKAIYDLKGGEEIPIEKPTANQKDMTPEERAKAQEELAKKGQGGGSGKLPTGDELVKKYGESSGDPSHTAFILADGRGVDLPAGTIHDQMLGGKSTDIPSPREQFIDQGNIRLRAHNSAGGRSFTLSIPAKGVTESQINYLEKMAPQLGSGDVHIEVGKENGEYRKIEYGKAFDQLEKTIRDMVPVVKEESGLPALAEKHLTPEERQGVSKSERGTAGFVAKLEKQPAVQEFKDIAQAGEGGRKWYQRSTKAFDSMVKEAPEYFKEDDRDKFLGLLAATSPQQTVAMNLKEALNTWTKYIDMDRPTGDKLEKMLSGELTLPAAKVPNAMKALAGEPLWPDLSKNENFKVASFHENLKGFLNKVTNDGWMGLFSGTELGLGKPSNYHPISVMTRAAAKELNWEPGEAQAAIWAFTKTFTEHGETSPEAVRAYSEDFADIMAHDQEVRAQLQTLGVDLGELDKHLKAIGEKPEVSSRASASFEDSLRKLTARIEKARGKGAIPAPKTGTLGFPEDEGTSFNPEDFGARPSPLGKIKKK